ncbi:MAG TPA: hypothetical protein ENN40_01290, partial [Candidatus Aminicenantes bacterium]|nr:hypothetical protein [Candidatus Aminicenantes bacterium]
MRRINSRLLLRAVGSAALVCLITWLAAVLLLPGIIRGKIMAQARLAGVELFGVAVESVGLHGMVVCDAVIKSGNVRVDVPLLRVQYSLPGLLRGEIKAAHIFGSHVEIQSPERQVRLTDLNGVLRMAQPDPESGKEWLFRGQTQFEGNSLDLEARVNSQTGRGQVVLRCRDLAAASFLKFLPGSYAVLMNGDLAIVAEVEINDRQPQKSRFVLDSKRLHILHSGLETVLALKAEGEVHGVFESYNLHAELNVGQFEHDRISVSEAFGVRVDMGSEAGMRAEFSSLAIRHPLELVVDDLKARSAGSPFNSAVLFSGNLALQKGSFLRRQPDCHFSGTFENQVDGLSWAIKAEASGPLQAALD